MRLLAVDGNSIVNRAFYGIRPLTTKDGQFTNAIYGFLTMLYKIKNEENPDAVAIAFDLKTPTFRHKAYAGYKATRKGMPEELASQMEPLKKLLTLLGYRLVTCEGFEADDILGTLAKACEENGNECVIATGDRDSLQLVSDKTSVHLCSNKQDILYTPEKILETYGVTPKELIEIKAIQGDTSDNIPGVPGIGEKTATALIAQYGSIENCYAHVDEIKPPRASKNLKENYELAQMSKTLATIEIHADIDYDLQSARLEQIKDLYTEEAYLLCKRLEFKNLLGRFEETNAEPEDAVFLRTVTDFSEAEELFETIAKEEKAGAALLTEETPKDGPMADRSRSLVGMAVAYGSGEPDVVYFPAEGFLTGDYLKEKLTELQKQIPVFCVMDGKEFLKDMPDADEAHLFDAGILLPPKISSTAGT